MWRLLKCTTARVEWAKAPFGYDFNRPPSIADQLRLHHRWKIADAGTGH
jgi:hypothetical protein